MHDNETRALSIVEIKNCVLAISCAATIVSLYWLSRSWHCLWALLMLCATSCIRTGRAAEIHAQAKLEKARAERAD